MKNLKKSLTLISSLPLFIGLTAVTLNADAGIRTVQKSIYHVVFSGGELGAKPNVCTKIASAGKAVVTCTGNLPEDLIAKIRESNAKKIEVSSGGNGAFVFTATRVKQVRMPYRDRAAL